MTTEDTVVWHRFRSFNNVVCKYSFVEVYKLRGHGRLCSIPIMKSVVTDTVAESAGIPQVGEEFPAAHVVKQHVDAGVVMRPPPPASHQSHHHHHHTTRRPSSRELEVHGYDNLD